MAEVAARGPDVAMAARGAVQFDAPGPSTRDAVLEAAPDLAAAPLR